MEIIKEAFDEGRETTTEWDKSKAKKNKLKLEVAAENLSLMKKRDFNSAIPLHQICPDTGKVLRTFPSRIAAARYIVSDILKRPEKNPLSITGNMEICMRGGWKSYGFYWKLATQESIKKYDKTPVNAKKVFVGGGGSHVFASSVFPSIQAAADSIGVSAKVVRTALSQSGKSKYIPKRYYVQEYNPKPITKRFKNLEEAAAFAKCDSTETIRRHIIQNKPINNVTYVVDSMQRLTMAAHEKVQFAKYVVYKGKKAIARVNSYSEIAEITGGHRTRVAIKVKENQPLGEFGQYRVVVRS